MTKILASILFFPSAETGNNNLKDVICSTFKLAPVKDSVYYLSLGFSLVQETY